MSRVVHILHPACDLPLWARPSLRRCGAACARGSVKRLQLLGGKRSEAQCTWMGRMHHMAGEARCCRTMLRMISGVQCSGTSPCTCKPVGADCGANIGPLCGGRRLHMCHCGMKASTLPFALHDLHALPFENASAQSQIALFVHLSSHTCKWGGLKYQRSQPGCPASRSKSARGGWRPPRTRRAWCWCRGRRGCTPPCTGSRPARQTPGPAPTACAVSAGLQAWACRAQIRDQGLEQTERQQFGPVCM